MSDTSPAAAPLVPLPVDEVLPEITGTLRDSRRLVLQAATGAGKTTRVPPALAATLDGRIVVLEPRRIAARAAAARIAEEREWELGGQVGYQIRFDRRWREDSRIVFATEGVLLRWLRDDPFLTGTGAVVLDEFHERSAASDTVLALLRVVQETVREDLRLVVMSATLAADELAAALDAPRIVSEGRAFPVEVSYLQRADDRRPSGHVATERVVAAVRAELRRDGRTGSILAFLPGVAEIRRAAEQLADAELPVHELYGDLPIERQAAVLRGPADRIVLATNVAETSVTVDGVTVVVDSGLHRQLRFDAANGLDRLELLPISRAAADQRAGRAGRQAPGRALRLWTGNEQANRLAADPPEIQRIDFAPTALFLRSVGEDPETLPWLDPPPAALRQRADALLHSLDALGPGGITARGRDLADLPVHPRLAALLLSARDAGMAASGAELAALLSERDILLEPPSTPTDSDLLDRWRALHGDTRGRVHRGRAAQVRRVADQLLGLLGGGERHRKARGEDRRRTRAADRVDATPDALARCLLAAYPDRVALLTGPSGPEGDGARGVMVGGIGVVLSPRCNVHLEPGAEALLLCTELGGALQRGDRRAVTVHSATRLERDWLDPDHLVEAERTTVDESSGRVGARRELVYRLDPDRSDPASDLVLESREAQPSTGAAARELERLAMEDPRSALGLDRDPLRRLLRRIACARDACPEAELPVVDDDLLRRGVTELVPGRRSLDAVRDAARSWLPAQFPWPARQTLDRLAPDAIELPNGRHANVDYPDDGPPVLAAQIQDLFGWQTTPRIADGRLPLLLHLLAPNQRPQQITDDLEGFWTGSYELVRRELAGRYPKHPWPKDPLHAEPVRRGRRR